MKDDARQQIQLINEKPKKKKKVQELDDSDDEKPKKKKRKDFDNSDDERCANIQDLELWKKTKQLDPDTMVFIIKGNKYPGIREALESRNWVENTDTNSSCFNLKWTVKETDIDHKQLDDFQIVNHFYKNTQISTKIGLTRNLRNLIYLENIDVDTFSPKCYDLNDMAEFEDFIEEFKISKAISILIEFDNLIKDATFDWQKFDKSSELRVKSALYICQRTQMTIIEKLQNMNINIPFVTADEWEIISNKFSKNDETYIQNQLATLNLILLFNEDDKNHLNMLRSKISQIIQYEQKNNPQFNISGYRNIWIIKPSGLSRGRGIKCFQELDKVMNYLCQQSVNNNKIMWVAQKYIENQLLINKRKFDIRQWVVVTDWDPLKIYFYDECYIRFCAEDYNLSNLNNKFVHLTNNSIQKHSENFDKFKEQSMWSQQQFAQYLKETYNDDIFYKKIQPMLKQIVKNSLISVQELVVQRKNSFEHFGYDFLIDENLQTWLIEVNSSPSMEQSTKITTKLVDNVSDDLIKLTVDLKMSKTKSKVNIGKWKLICNQEKPKYIQP